MATRCRHCSPGLQEAIESAGVASVATVVAAGDATLGATDPSWEGGERGLASIVEGPRCARLGFGLGAGRGGRGRWQLRASVRGLALLILDRKR